MPISSTCRRDRKRLIRQHARFLKQIRSVRKAMADYFAGQQFFNFYPDEPEEEEAEFELSAPQRGHAREPASRPRKQPRPFDDFSE